MIRNNLKLLAIALTAFLFVAAQAQQPIQVFNQILGTWVGKTQFNTDNIVLKKPLDTSVKVSTAVKGHYIEFERVLYMPGGPEETLSLLTFDPTAGLYEMWTFNQHSAGAKLLTGVMDSKGYLTLNTPAILEAGSNVVYRQIIHIESRDRFTLEYDLRLNDKWRQDFVTTFTRKFDK